MPTTDVRPNDVYAEQQQISNDLAAKSSLIPLALPDAKSMVSLNESGDGIINLPFVTAKGRKISLPITLTYVTSGVKIDQNSSDVGLGWNINIGSIVRDYGAFEPDYTFTGSELSMPDIPGTRGNDRKIRATSFSYHPAVGSTPATYSADADYFIAPINHNKIIDYDNTTGTAPDNYVLNVPGLESNDFWNSTAAHDATSPPPTFVFSDKANWQISYEKKTFTVSQEVSRINEFSFKEITHSTTSGGTTTTWTDLDGTGNMASAIAIFPYVPNGQSSRCVFDPQIAGCQGLSNFIPTLSGDSYIPSPNFSVNYEDYAKFTITTDDGTQYVFGRPLRAQKYLFTEEPFWSASMNNQWLYPDASFGSDLERSYGEFWKTDFIAEWLLTEIHSSDYVDANSNGYADDGDQGDWIKIDYTDPVQCENIAAMEASDLIPAHREFLNFVETDRSSALMKEHAYITKISTPIQIINFTTEKRFDVNHDYFNQPFNRYNGNYVYDGSGPGRYMFNSSSTGLMPWSLPGGISLSPSTENAHHNTDVSFPIELMRYDAATVSDNVSLGSPQIQNVTLNYAEQGASNQLAVSHYLILANDGTTFLNYDPSLIGQKSSVSGTVGLDSAYYFNSSGRGKTTLLGIDYRGVSSTSADKISYSFGYANNPSYDKFHIRDIWALGSATARESRCSAYSRWNGIRMIQSSTPRPGTGGTTGVTAIYDNYNLPNRYIRLGRMNLCKSLRVILYHFIN
jgi:hypothetical protein